MKYIVLILVLFASCNIIAPLQTKSIGEQFKQYEKECYNDSTMQVIYRNQGTVNENEITFNKDTIWTHKKPDVNEFIKKAK